MKYLNEGPGWDNWIREFLIQTLRLSPDQAEVLGANIEKSVSIQANVFKNCMLRS